MPRDCIFCGQRTFGKEDALPRWLGKLLLKGRKPKMIFDLRTTGYVEDHRYWTIRELAVRVQAVCKDCNNGWMSNLEAAMQSLASPMIDSGTPTVLDVNRQTLMATWAVKTAIVLEFARPSKTVVYRYYTTRERQRVKDMLMPPDNVFVWLGRHVNRSPGCHGLFHVLAGLRRGTEVVRGHASTFWFGQLVIQVLAHRPGEIRVGDRVPVRSGPWDTTLLQIWPPHQYASMWPPPAMTIEALKVLGFRFILGPRPKHRPRSIDRPLQP